MDDVQLDRFGAGALALLLTTSAARAQEWPGWRGPERNGIAPAAQAPSTWPEGFSPAWRVDVGEGYSSPVVSGDRVFVHSRRGDLEVVKAKDPVLNRYAQDSICRTWEVLADAVHPGGSAPLKSAGYPMAGRAKCDRARNIAPRMDVGRNRSKSFQVFRDGVKRLAGI